MLNGGGGGGGGGVGGLVVTQVKRSYELERSPRMTEELNAYNSNVNISAVLSPSRKLSSSTPGWVGMQEVGTELLFLVTNDIIHHIALSKSLITCRSELSMRGSVLYS